MVDEQHLEFWPQTHLVLPQMEEAHWAEVAKTLSGTLQQLKLLPEEVGLLVVARPSSFSLAQARRPMNNERIITHQMRTSVTTITHAFQPLHRHWVMNLPPWLLVGLSLEAPSLFVDCRKLLMSCSVPNPCMFDVLTLLWALLPRLLNLCCPPLVPIAFAALLSFSTCVSMKSLSRAPFQDSEGL